MERNRRLKVYQIIRVVLAFLIPLPFILFAYVWHSINAFYHPDSYDPESYWLDSIPSIGLVLVIGIFVGLWKFRSQQVGKWMSIAGVIILVVLVSITWMVL